MLAESRSKRRSAEHGQNKHQPPSSSSRLPSYPEQIRGRSFPLHALFSPAKMGSAASCFLSSPPAPYTWTETLVFESRLAPKTADSRIVGLLVYLLLVLSRAMIWSNLRCTAMTGTCGGTAASSWAPLSWASRIEYSFLVADFFSRKRNQT